MATIAKRNHAIKQSGKDTSPKAVALFPLRDFSLVSSEVLLCQSGKIVTGRGEVFLSSRDRK